MKIDVLGVKINADTKNTIVFLIKKMLAERQKIFIVTPYSEMIVRAQTDSAFREVLNSATIALPDGIGILWAAHYLKYKNLFSSLVAIIFRPNSIRDPIPEKISGSEFIYDLARIAEDRGYSVFLLGGFNDTPKLAAEKLKSKFPNLKIAGVSNQLTTDIHADFLFAALGPVRQEKWIVENLKQLNIRLAVGLGGTLDYLAGKQPPAPQIWRSAGLEWLWRLLTQPWRLWRVLKGVSGLIWYAFKRSSRSRE